MAGARGLIETASCPVWTSVGAGPKHRRAKRHHACPGPFQNPNHHKLKGIHVAGFAPLRIHKSVDFATKSPGELGPF